MNAIYHLSNIANRFNQAKLSYDSNCQVQQRVGQDLIARLTFYRDSFDNILDLGCGTGLVTKELAACYPNYHRFYALDIADQLLAIAKERLPKLRFIKADFDHFKAANLKFDLIFANMSLQWSSDLAKCCVNINHNLATDGIVACSLPLKGTFANIGSTLDFLSKNQMNNIFSQNGLQILAVETKEIIRCFPTMVEGLRSIKLAGASYCREKNLADYPRMLRSRKQPNFNLTYRIGSFIAQKARGA
jgi:malonyl-CoA O-methyltransferase